MSTAPREGWDEPVCGMTWGWVGVADDWRSPAAAESMTAMAELGVNWVTIAYSVDQPDAHSTSLMLDAERVVSDDDIRAAVARARTLGLKVCLKPVVNCADGTWRAYISFLTPDVPGEPTWADWFATYSAWITDAARLAAELDVEMLCVGCEMVMSDGQEELWRALIADVRAVYGGLVTYNCDKYQEDRVSWWDAVDVISSSGYYPTGTWEQHLDRIEAVVRREGKPFCFLEAGCPSRTGSPARPNDWNLQGAPDEDAQAGYLDEMLTAVASRPWVGGLMLWDWPAVLYPADRASEDDDYCMYAKKGAEVVAARYRDLFVAQQH